MAEYEVKCVDLDYDSRYDDCRAIERLGFTATEGGLTRSSPAEVFRIVEETDHTVYVVYHGERSTLQAATDGDTRYVRAAAEDTADDPLLKQPSC